MNFTSIKTLHILSQQAKNCREKLTNLSLVTDIAVINLRGI